MTHPLRSFDLLAAFGTGGLLTLMIQFNGTMAFHTTPFFSSLAAHGVGAIAALVFLAILPASPQKAVGEPRAPFWAYLGGLSGAITVMLSGITVNTALALSGTLALGLAGQVLFGLAADRWGLFGMARRKPGPRDLAAVGFIVAGSLVLIYGGGNP